MANFEATACTGCHGACRWRTTEQHDLDTLVQRCPKVLIAGLHVRELFWFCFAQPRNIGPRASFLEANRLDSTDSYIADGAAVLLTFVSRDEDIFATVRNALSDVDPM